MDADLVVRAQQGDRHAFELMVDAIGDRLESVAIGILRDPEDAKDATQRALLAIWQHLPRLRDPARFDAWPYRILVHACRAEGRGSRRWLPNVLARIEERPDDADVLGAVVERDQLERAFRHLSLDQPAVVVLYHYLALPRDAIADALDIPLGTVHSRRRGAMAALRAALEADARRPAPALTTKELALKRLVDGIDGYRFDVAGAPDADGRGR